MYILEKSESFKWTPEVVFDHSRTLDKTIKSILSFCFIHKKKSKTKKLQQKTHKKTILDKNQIFRINSIDEKKITIYYFARSFR